MSVSKYVSDVKIIPHNQEMIFNYLSNFENLSKYLTEDVLLALSDKVPQITIRNFKSDQDACQFEIGGFGMAEVRIVERTPFSTIKVQGQGDIPVDLAFWIQLLPIDAYQTKMRLVLHAEMGMMIKMMVGNKLEKGLDQLADTLALLPYGPL
jgi:hypothetical protein